MANKARIPKGTRDFSPEEVTKRQFIMNVMRSEFERFGFRPIETPSMELSETLMGKYGDEGDRLIFRILNSGDFLNKADQQALEEKDSAALASSISDKALRYDLTVPFARYVVQHQNEIVFPFKRYQIQPVWRADRPQKGRFREFYQCDADVVGSDSLFQEIECIQLYDRVFHKLGLKGVTIKINNRKILAGIAEIIGAADKLIPFTVALDKLDKIGKERVCDEMRSKGIDDESLNQLDPLFELSGSFEDKLKVLRSILKESQTGISGIEDMEFLAHAMTELKLKSAGIELDVTLARGLNYYTGSIFEVQAPEGINMGSIGGGGRYDDLTGIFGMKGVSGVGISFGLDRIYLVMDELGLFPKSVRNDVQVLFLNFGDAESIYALKAVEVLREADINCELYPDRSKVNKQMTYANKRQIPFVVMAGENEIKDEVYTLKDMTSGDQERLTLKQLKDKFK